ncbi:MAG: hypothetical protein A3I89_00880 [Candidatus Harrisonbacteria bacterium RIFCSPLOWO2_02_FULL_41_11]|nr:MAG: hypothetical protein A3I89_00880 [Candidatus Harrisonbacteria bacterium RIFCSPLOWO2_02_FULL_41_11]
MLKLIFSSSIGATLAVIFATVITIWGELSPGMKDILKNISGHHWVTKSFGVLAVYLVVFVLTYWLGGIPTPVKVRRSLYMLLAAVILGGVAILGFFIWHYWQ